MKKLLYKFLGLFFNKYDLKSARPKNGPWIIKGNILLYNGGNKAYKKWILSSYLHTNPGIRLPLSYRNKSENDPNTFFMTSPNKTQRKICDRKLFDIGFVKTENEEVYEKMFEVVCNNLEDLNKLYIEVTTIMKELTWQK